MTNQEGRRAPAAVGLCAIVSAGLALAVLYSVADWRTNQVTRGAMATQRSAAPTVPTAYIAQAQPPPQVRALAAMEPSVPHLEDAGATDQAMLNRRVPFDSYFVEHGLPIEVTQATPVLQSDALFTAALRRIRDDSTRESGQIENSLLAYMNSTHRGENLTINEVECGTTACLGSVTVSDVEVLQSWSAGLRVPWLLQWPVVGPRGIEVRFLFDSSQRAWEPGSD